MTTDNFRGSFFKSATDEVSLKLVEVDHPDLTTPMRFVSDTVDMVHQGNTYTAMPELDIPFPSMRKGEISRLQLVYADILNERIAVVRGISGSFDVTVFSVLASAPDVIEGGPFYFKIRKSEKNEEAIMMGDLSMDDEVLNEAAVEDCFTPSTSPGLF